MKIWTEHSNLQGKGLISSKDKVTVLFRREFFGCIRFYTSLKLKPWYLTSIGTVTFVKITFRFTVLSIYCKMCTNKASTCKSTDIAN